MISSDELAAAVGGGAGHELREAALKIKHCLNQLSDEQIWWREDESQNSIGNLVLHLCGNLRQWIVAGIGGAKDERDRPEEFAERTVIPRAELVRRIDDTVAASCAVLQNVTADDLTRVRRIQEWDVTGIAAIFDAVPHFRGHTQEIIHITRHLLGDKYKFWWTPGTTLPGREP